MRQLGLPEDLMQTVKDFYDEASSAITLPAGNTPAIPWRVGTKQGCPLSSVLFSICIEPILRMLAKRKEELGYEIAFHDRSFYVNALAYADDLILITDTEAKLEAMLEILREFCTYAHMTVNAKKCCVISSVIGDSGRRDAIEKTFMYADEPLPSPGTNRRPCIWVPRSAAHTRKEPSRLKSA
jgi:hypothetical protein